ncbi:unnamed protein product [Sphagnum balticum]
MEKDGEDIWALPEEKESVLKKNGAEGAVKKNPTKIRMVPEFYILPRRSIPKTIALYAFLTAAGVGAGMLVEQWINIQVANDTAILFRKDKDSDKKDS